MENEEAKINAIPVTEAYIDTKAKAAALAMVEKLYVKSFPGEDKDAKQALFLQWYCYFKELYTQRRAFGPDLQK